MPEKIYLVGSPACVEPIARAVRLIAKVNDFSADVVLLTDMPKEICPNIFALGVVERSELAAHCFIDAGLVSKVTAIAYTIYNKVRD